MKSTLPAVAVEIAERPVRLRGSRLARWALGLLGWRVQFDGLPAAQGVAVVYPHTSNWGFPVGLLAKWAIGLPVTFWAKDTLFAVPLFGRWLRSLAGVPVGLVRLDCAQRRIGFDSFWLLSGHMAADFAVFARRLSDSRGFRPALAAPVRPLE